MNLNALRSTSHVKVIAQRFMLCFDHPLQKFADGKEGRKEGGEDDVEVEQIASSEIEGCCIADRWVFEIEVGESFSLVEGSEGIFWG